jgi:uncharacterized membrane protein (UPF0182 family)
VGLGQVSSDSYFPGGSVFGVGGQVNYIRNSVKAVVNSYTGKVALYQWHPGSSEADPVLRTWMKAFPGIIQNQDQIPPALMAHLRYPEVLFEAQRQILAQYHVQQAEQFYGGQNFWTVPDDPTGTTTKRTGPQFTQPPYYLTMSMPGYTQPQFSLTTSFNPRGRQNMAAYMAVDSNPTSRDYGTIRLLNLPQDTAIAGPGQVQNDFESNAVVASALSLLRQGGSKVTTGNLITLPVGGGLVYFEPVYVSQSSGGDSGSFPTLKKVLVFYNGNVGYGDNLTDALSQVFTVTPPSTGGTGTTPPGNGSGNGGGSGTGTVNANVLKFLQQAETFYNQAQTALKSGDLAAYGRDIAKVKTALDSAKLAAQATSKAAPKSGSSPAPSPSPSASKSS